MRRHFHPRVGLTFETPSRLIGSFFPAQTRLSALITAVRLICQAYGNSEGVPPVILWRYPMATKVDQHAHDRKADISHTFAARTFVSLIFGRLFHCDQKGIPARVE